MDNLFLGIESSMAMCQKRYEQHDELMSRATNRRLQKTDFKPDRFQPAKRSLSTGFLIAFNRRRDRFPPAA